MWSTDLHLPRKENLWFTKDHPLPGNLSNVKTFPWKPSHACFDQSHCIPNNPHRELFCSFLPKETLQWLDWKFTSLHPSNQTCLPHIYLQPCLEALKRRPQPFPFLSHSNSLRIEGSNVHPHPVNLTHQPSKHPLSQLRNIKWGNTLLEMNYYIICPSKTSPFYHCPY